MAIANGITALVRNSAKPCRCRTAKTRPTTSIAAMAQPAYETWPSASNVRGNAAPVPSEQQAAVRAQRLTLSMRRPPHAVQRGQGCGLQEGDPPAAACQHREPGDRDHRHRHSRAKERGQARRRGRASRAGRSAPSWSASRSCASPNASAPTNVIWNAHRMSCPPRRRMRTPTRRRSRSTDRHRIAASPPAAARQRRATCSMLSAGTASRRAARRPLYIVGTERAAARPDARRGSARRSCTSSSAAGEELPLVGEEPHARGR